MADGDTSLDPVAYRIGQAQKAHARGLVLCEMDGKRPCGKGWQKQKPPTVEVVEAWATLGNIGIRTGEVSGVVVIDDDTAEQNAAELLSLPATPIVLTGGGGPRGEEEGRYQVPCGLAIARANRLGLPGRDVHARCVLPEHR